LAAKYGPARVGQRSQIGRHLATPHQPLRVGNGHFSQGPSEPDFQGRAIRALKRFARSYDCGVIVVAHPTKDVKLPNGDIRQPILYDISGSSHWYNAADHGVIVVGDTTTNVREVVVAKSRYRIAGTIGSGWLKLENGRLRSTAKR
jgi:hypothetical protein